MPLSRSYCTRVGREGHRLVARRDGCCRRARAAAPAPANCARSRAPAAARRRSAAGAATSRQASGARASQPSSRCSSNATASISPASAGAQAASGGRQRAATGRTPPPPWRRRTARNRPRRRCRSSAPRRRAASGACEKPAETSAIVPASSGSASSAWKCSRWRIAEKPERSSSAMKSGQRPDRERVGRGEALLHAADREVGRQIDRADRYRQVVGRDGPRVLPAPIRRGPARPRCASMREQQPVGRRRAGTR